MIEAEAMGWPEAFLPLGIALIIWAFFWAFMRK